MQYYLLLLKQYYQLAGNIGYHINIGVILYQATAKIVLLVQYWKIILVQYWMNLAILRQYCVLLLKNKKYPSIYGGHIWVLKQTRELTPRNTPDIILLVSVSSLKDYVQKNNFDFYNSYTT